MIPAIIQHVAKAGHHAPSADNCQPWRFEWDGFHLHLRYDSNRVRKNTFPPLDPATLLAMGAAFENILSAARHCRLEPRYQLFPDSTGPNPLYATLDFTGHSSHPIPTRDPRLFLRHTNRLPYRKGPLPADVVSELSSMAAPDVRLKLITAGDEIGKVADLISKASEIRFQTREVHEWLGRSLRFSAAEIGRNDGLDVNTLHLPPGGKSLLKVIKDWKRMERLNRLGMHKLLAAIDAAPLKKGSAILATIGNSDRVSLFSAGRIMTRAWTLLNTAGIAVHPYYVVADILTRHAAGRIPAHLQAGADSARVETERQFGLAPREVLCMLFRVGFPTRDPVRSRRLPLDSVLLDMSDRYEKRG